MTQATRAAGRGGRVDVRIRPTRTRRVAAFLLSVLVAALMVGDVYLNVQRVRFGKEIQVLRQEVNDLGSEVRDLEGNKAGMTSLVSIEQRARDMGMTYPKMLPRTLIVEVPQGEVPPTWAMPSPHKPMMPDRVESQQLAEATLR